MTQSTFDLIDTFSRRPFLSPLARAALRAELRAQYPLLSIDPDVAVVKPADPTSQASGQTLSAHLRTRIGTGKTLQWTNAEHKLVTDPHQADLLVPSVDVEQLAILIDSVALDLLAQYMKALVDFWSQPDQGGASPWQQLAQALERQHASASQSADHQQPAVGTERFEKQAFSVLESQLAQIRDVLTLDLGDFDEIERYLAKVTDIAPLLTDHASADAVPRVSLDQLPTWLRAASSGDRLDYSRRMAGLAVVCARAEGKSWNDDLPPILEYARRAVQDALRDDHPEQTLLSLDDVTVHIAKVTAAPVPSTGQINALGSVEKVQMSVAEFALGNLSSLPHGTITLTTRDSWPLPGWLTADYLKQLVVRTDIGAAYPALVRRYLVTDQAQAVQRRRLFSDHLRVQLPLKALEQKIRGQGGVTQAGYRQVCSLLQASESKGVATVLRSLAWRAEPGAKPDIVSNMFVIGATDTQVGPFLLYRPFAQVSLTEYPSWRALREAIATAGDLQDEVLAWMSGPARRRYANGGFHEPHVTRFGLGSDFAPLRVPPPAVLAEDVAQGDVMTLLFDANAQALVDLADRASVSNAESRWAMFQQGGWLILDAVMPFISGAVGSALWLLQVMMAVDRVLVTQKRRPDREGVEAWNNLLLTISMVVLHQGFAPGAAIRRGAEAGTTALEEKLPEPTPQAESLPSSSPATIDAVQHQLLDFSWSSARQQLSQAQALELARLKVSSAPTLPEPSFEPGKEGLYRLNQKWLAKLDSGVYEVDFADETVFVVDPKQPSIRGPRLRQVDRGWELDMSLRLRGGGPKRNLRQMAEQNAATLKRVSERTAVLDRSEGLIYRKFADWEASVQRRPSTVTEQFLDAVEASAKELCAIVEERRELQQSLRAADRAADKVTGVQLKGLVLRIAFMEQALDHASSQAAGARLAGLHADGGGVVTPQNVDAYLKLFEDLLKLQDRGVHWAQLRGRYWDTLRNVPKVGEAYWREAVLEFERNDSLTFLEWRVYRMWSLLELSFTTTDILSGEGDQTLKGLRTDEQLHAAFSSHAELEKSNDYSLAEQISVLESSLREYRRGTLIVTQAQESPVQPLNEASFKRFVEELQWFTEYAETRLSDSIRESAEPSQQPREYAPKVKQPRKRVFKTRAQRTLVGRLTDGEPGMQGEVVEVTQPGGKKVVGTYHLHENGEWVEVKTPPRAGTVKSEPSLSRVELSRQASAGLDRIEADINSAVGHSKRSGEPADIEDLLVRKADALTGLADKLSARPGTGGAGETAASAEQALVVKLRQGAARLIAQGRTLRVAMIKAQPPTGARLSYLAAQGEVSIERVAGRKNMSGGKRDDFLQEYVIRDKDSKALWWAHFHYASEDAPAAAFTAAHLKLPSQRLLGYKAQLKAAKDNREVISIYRATLGKDIAQRLFLVLKPKAQTTHS